MRLIFAFLILSTTVSIQSYDPEHTKLKNKKPSEIDGLVVQSKLGDKIPLELNFKNEEGKSVSLGSFFNQGKPVILSMVYYRCPTLCNHHLNGINKVLKETDWNLGDKFLFLAVSIDPTETPELAQQKRNAYMEDYKSNGKFRLDSGMHFLTGDETSSRALADSLGFPYRYNPGNNQWIHPAVAYIITPDGKISRYFNGISFAERDLKLSLVEATDGKIGSIMEKVALFCFQFDPNKNKYILYAFNLMRIGGGITALFIAGYLITFWRKNKNSL